VSYVDVLQQKVTVGKKVAIIGAGGIGFDVAEYLTHQPATSDEISSFLQEWGVDQAYNHAGGITKPVAAETPREVYLLKRSTGKHGASLGKTTGWIHKASLVAKQVKMIADVEYLKVDDEGLHISIKGDNQTLPVDHVVVCAGQVSARSMYDQLEEAGVKSHLIGGAYEASELDAKRAIYQACTLAAEI
jgi:2,4-dienoyl-CoA reductase (NADPH2)